MTRLASPGTWGTVLLGLAGVWLLLAPAWVGFRSGGWSAASIDDLVVGGVLVLAAATSLFAQVALGLGDLVAQAARRAAASEGASEAGRASPQG
jgi:hypothetical protein